MDETTSWGTMFALSVQIISQSTILIELEWTRMRGRRTLRILVGAIGLIAILGVAGYFAWFRAESNQLNVVLVTLDTTRADRVGCYGYRPAQTPVIDALASTGVLFEFARTPYPLTLPAHASLFTGLNPPEHGLQVNGRGHLSNQIPVLAEILRSAKYETGAFVAAYVLNAKFGLNRGFETYDGELSASAHQHQMSDRQRDGQMVLDLALGWLRQRTSRPFFCWIHLYDPHGPYDARTKLFGDTFANRPYDAGIAYVDRQLGRLQEFLAQQKLLGRTLVVVVGDHGEGLLEHNESEHGNQLYDSTLRVPLIFAGPSIVKPGIRVPTPVSLIDVMPTILDYLQMPLPKPVAGRSVKPALMGESLPAIPCYAESELAFLESRCAPLQSVTTERWKFIETTDPELYDLAADPQELKNLIATESIQAQEMKNLLEQLREKMTPTSADSINLTANEKHILASLGYVGGTRSVKPAVPGDRLPDVKEMLPQYLRLADARERANRGEVAEATEMVRKILKDAPGYSTARLLLGDLLLRAQAFADAAKEYAAVVVDQPESAEAHANWANALAAQGLLDAAVGHYRKALEIEPDDASFHYYFAFTLNRMGKSADAIGELQQAVRINPAFVDARLPLSKLLAETGRTAEAVHQYEAALKYRSNLPRPPWIPNRDRPKQR